jgi:bifunctional enzyme CysN/CysC
MSHQSELIATDIDAYLAQHERKELLRFITCGSVDDGKSTLIGRLLYDSKMIYEDQLAAVKSATVKHGTTNTDFDPALLTDGLKAEREQGITIDVAYRYFSTAKRKFIIADCPGHEQYTRNMATGASTADLAIILIDARKGVLTQTRRHSFIVSLLGIKHVVVAINKMDLVGFSEGIFDNIKAAYTDFADRLQLPDVQFVPIAALHGDNLVDKSVNMPWYGGSTLMHILENVHIASDRNLIDFRFPVQFVNRPNLDFRGYCGTVSSGIVRPGDEVTALPSGVKAKITKVYGPGGVELREGFAPQSITVTLDREIDCSRGDMMAHVHNTPRVDRVFEAFIVWMNEEAMQPGKQYLIKQTSKVTPGSITKLRYRMDVNTLHRDNAAQQLALNEIGRCVIETARPLCFDPYQKNRSTGAFVVIDRLTNATVGAGMILDREVDKTELTAQRLAERMRGPHGYRHSSSVTSADRAKKLAQKPATIWLTGLTGSGKSSIAYALEKKLFDLGKTVHVFDSRHARLGLSADLDFTDSGRRENIRRAAEVAKLMNEAGLISICSFLSPKNEDRKQARETIGRDRYIEVFVSAPPEVCRKRLPEQPKPEPGLEDFDPVNTEAAMYEAPKAPDLALDTTKLSVEQSVETILGLLKQRGVI